MPRATQTAGPGEKVHLINNDYGNELLLNKGKEVDAALGLRRSRAAILLILSLPGSAYMYQSVPPPLSSSAAICRSGSS